MKISLKYVALAVIALCFVLWLIISFTRAYEPKENRIYAQVQAREYAISSKVAGRVENIFVKKGDMLKRVIWYIALILQSLRRNLNRQGQDTKRQRL